MKDLQTNILLAIALVTAIIIIALIASDFDKARVMHQLIWSAS